MRRINVKTGIKQRMPDILGDDSGTEPSVSGTVPGITPWSVQSQMIKNMRRIVSALVGNSVYGRVMSGLEIVSNGSGTLIIGRGYGFTKQGNIIVLENDCYKSGLPNGTSHISILHKMAEVDANSDPSGLETPLIGEEGLYNVVYDDYAATQGSSINSTFDNILLVSSNPPSVENCVYLGSVVITAGVITSVNQRQIRGFYPNSADDVNGVINSLKTDLIQSTSMGEQLVIADPELRGTVEIPTGASNKLVVDGIEGATGQFVDKDGNTIVVKKGIITDLSWSPGS